MGYGPIGSLLDGNNYNIQFNTTKMDQILYLNKHNNVVVTKLFVPFNVWTHRITS